MIDPPIEVRRLDPQFHAPSAQAPADMLVDGIGHAVPISWGHGVWWKRRLNALIHFNQVLLTTMSIKRMASKYTQIRGPSSPGSAGGES